MSCCNDYFKLNAGEESDATKNTNFMAQKFHVIRYNHHDHHDLYDHCDHYNHCYLPDYHDNYITSAHSNYYMIIDYESPVQAQEN